MVRHTDTDDARTDTEDLAPRGRFAPEDVSFDAYAIAAAWEAADDVPVCVAVAITNDFTNLSVTAADGEKTDGDVHFGGEPGDDDYVLFEEKAVGVCPRDVAEEFSPAYVDLPDRDDGFVLAVNTWQIFD